MSDMIPCPKCQTPIAVDNELYLKGETFSCSNCDHKLGMEEPTDLSIEKLNELKRFSKMRKPGASSQIPCPDCGTPIPFTDKDLKAGSSVACTECKASVGLQN
ncbi:MAG: hypothetical protein ACSHWW_06325 [Nonlabens sp.]|uniref:hypothetical protein n=1 Tax=Nonlabens sp. TaxID=1888209 RepID=UPI003EF99888